MRLYISAIALSALLMGGCGSATVPRPSAHAFDFTSTGTRLASRSLSRVATFSQSPDATGPTLFVSTDTTFKITMWRSNVRIPVGQIKSTGSPLGMVFDRLGNLFVATGNPDGWIIMYPPPYKEPAEPSIYTKHVPFFPTELGIGPDGTLYAADIDGNVYAFAHGSKTPTLTISLPTDGQGPSTGQGFAFDSHGNVLISYQSYFDDANDVLKCPPDSANCMRLNLQQFMPNGIGGMGDLALDAKGNIVLSQSNPYLLVYKPDPSSPTGYSSIASRTITLNGSTWPSELKFNVTKTRLYIGDTGPGNVFVLTWPGAAAVKTYFVASPVYSIALWPGAPQ
jgi:hypothetical protein